MYMLEEIGIYETGQFQSSISYHRWENTWHGIYMYIPYIVHPLIQYIWKDAMNIPTPATHPQAETKTLPSARQQARKESPRSTMGKSPINGEIKGDRISGFVKRKIYKNPLLVWFYVDFSWNQSIERCPAFLQAGLQTRPRPVTIQESAIRKQLWQAAGGFYAKTRNGRHWVSRHAWLRVWNHRKSIHLNVGFTRCL